MDPTQPEDLTPEILEAWLTSKPAESTVGWSGSFIACPIARIRIDRGEKDPSVRPERTYVVKPGGSYIGTRIDHEPWLAAFITALDASFAAGCHRVTAEHALAILHQTQENLNAQ